MKQRYMKRMIAFVMAFALVLTGSGISVALNNATASAASKKVTLKLKKSKVSLKEGSKTTLKITKKNVKKIKSQKWTTSKKSVATVSAKGKVTAKKAGKATIKVKVKYIAKGSKKAKSKTLKCTVTVTAKAATTQEPAATTPGATVTAAPTDTPVPTPTPFVKFTWNDKSNIGEAQEVHIEGGIEDTITKKDNGTVRPELSSQYLVDNEMGLAINLGNTMEATLSIAEKMKHAANGYADIDATAFETSWGAKVTTQQYMDCLHSYGVNTVRVPVAWSNMDSEDGTYQINEKYLGRVEEVVNYALNNGMYVIINDHWDGGWWGQFGAAMRNESNEKVPDEERRKEAWKRYESYWTQIAERFKGYSDHLIFESANEELGDRLTDGICANGYGSSEDPNEKPVSGKLSAQERYDLTNAINQKFLDIVRASGDNNAYRHLLIAGYNTNFGNTVDARFKMPKDTEENGTTKLFVSVHSYYPGNYCLDQGTGEYTDADKAGMAKEFTKLQRFVDEGYGIIVGEDGVCQPRAVSNTARTVPQRFRDAIEMGAQYHATICFWETGQYFDRGACKLKFKDVAELFNELTDSNGDTSMTGLTGLENQVNGVEDVSLKTPKWSWRGIWYKNGGNSMVGEGMYEEGGGKPASGKDDFVPESNVITTIEGDATEIEFNNYGYQAFIKLDLSKYKKPAIKFIFDENIPNPAENIGGLQLAVNDVAEYADGSLIDYNKFNNMGVLLEGELAPTEEKPWLSISFTSKPTVTGIDIYEMDE